MNFFKWLAGMAVVPLMMAGEAGAADEGWDARLAGALSGRLKEIEKELAGISPELEKLPGIPIDDQGGTGGYAAVYQTAVPKAGELHAVEVRWPEPAMVEMIALVPTRRYDAKGLDPQYGMPDAFAVELIDEAGTVVAKVAGERGLHGNRVRKGHPFVYQVSPPVEATGVRVSAEKLNPDGDGEGSYVHAWAEVFAFDGERNVSLGTEVRSVGGSSPPAPWRWNADFLVDGQTPLGLPEVPAGEHSNIGWLSDGRKRADESASLFVDLEKSVPMDGVRLIPARKPTSDLPSGFGFPRKVRVMVSDTNDAEDRSKWTVVAERTFLNPGHNPVIIRFDGTRGRHVWIEATELWKEYEGYPAFFALSEVEVLEGDENLAEGKPVRSSDGMLNLIAPGGKYWSGAALSDGYGPDGKLVSVREWLGRLDERLRLETRRHELRMEAARVIAGWRNAGLAGYAVLGLGAAFLLIVLPIRFRVLANRELVKVRERIAGDLHDEVGSNLGSIQMFADLAEGRSGESEELKRIQRIAAETVSAVRDIVWLLRPQGDHRIATVEHLRETSSIMLESYKWEFTANEEAWGIELAEEANRDLFLYFREALHNIARHAKAKKVSVRVERTDGHLELVICDDGLGIAPERLERPATLRALRQRSAALAANLKVDSAPGEGTRLTLRIPLDRKRLGQHRRPMKS